MRSTAIRDEDPPIERHAIRRRLRLVAALAPLSLLALPSASAWAQTQSFVASYAGQGAFSSSCNATMDIVGEEPATGTHPVFLWMVGTFEADIDDTPSHTIVAGMAARGFVAASIQYDNSFFGTCDQIGGKAQCIFDANSAASAVSVLCGRPSADCRKGIVVGGLSQGSILVDLARNYDARVRAGWGMGDGTDYAFFDLSSCVPPAARALPRDRLRVVNGENDGYLSGDDHSRTQSAAVTGYDCGPTAWDCLQADGSGYYIVQDSQVQDGDADHCYWGDGGCIASQTDLDAGWESGGDPWQLAANLDWLAGFAGFCGDGAVQSAAPFDEQCDLGGANGVAGSCCTASCTYASASAVCRPAAGECDLAESCTGTSDACPADGKQPSGTACLDDGNPCTLDRCDGTSSACAHSAGNAGAICRAAAGVCDVAETCTGTSATCPADAFASSVTECRPSAGPCDVGEHCSGTSTTCPADGFASSTTVCRPAAGSCDVAEHCTGTTAACPADGFVSSATMCRPSTGICDVAENCTGTSAACPADGFAASTTPCRLPAGPCDVAENCTGTTAACPANGFASSTTVCRPSAGVCDVAETCAGTNGACPPDGFAATTTVCRPSAGVCDVVESCTGTSAACPADQFAASATVCRGSAGVCDVADHCTGSTAACPADAFASSATVCRSTAGPCDVAENCTGSSPTCPTDAFASATTVCRPAAGDCDAAEHCTGAGASCPIDASQPDGTACDDGTTCTLGDACVGGACTGDSTVCGDGVVQTSCGETCDDGNTTGGDGCSAACQTEFVCGPAPQPGCKRPIAPAAAKLRLKDASPDTGDAVAWKWAKGAITTFAELGAPLSTTDYLLCIYDAGRGLVASTRAPAGQLCAGRSCWSANAAGFKYKDRDATPDGLTAMTLRPGGAGRSKIVLKGKGVLLQTPSLPMMIPVTVQLRNSDGACWEAVYSAPAQKNGATEFQDSSD